VINKHIYIFHQNYVGDFIGPWGLEWAERANNLANSCMREELDALKGCWIDMIQRDMRGCRRRREKDSVSATVLEI
jgi:hypothetical protein